MLPIWLPHYEKQYGDLEASIVGMVLKIRPRTLDRVLRSVKKKHGCLGMSGTRHGSYLKSNIPIKISHKDVDKPGFMQADTVAHCGESLAGDFVWSLTFTDVLSGWTENGAIWNKSEHEVHRMLKGMEDRLPFGIKGFHTDNGSEFINYHIHSYYRDREQPVIVTRGRSGHGNDSPHVEQKNYTHVRLLFGYHRIENQALIKSMNQLYEASSLLSNFFCANRRLVLKERRGSKYYKKYDNPVTPCDRLLDSEHITEWQKTCLTEMKLNLDPYKLRRLIDAKQKEIFDQLR